MATRKRCESVFIQYNELFKPIDLLRRWQSGDIVLDFDNS